MSGKIASLTPEEIRETAMVDLVYELLYEKGEPMLYRDLFQEVARLKGFTEEEMARYIAQLYTEINIDGRFICVGKSLWGLKKWYPTEQATDSAVQANVKDDFDEDLEEDLFEEEEDELFDDEQLDEDDVFDDEEFEELDEEEVEEAEEEEEDLI
ncbi:DNA-directed RNA polymerase subunit delta [Polycladomyces subterraneus]|uniref:Probable DNA-directed RNA polymerase subunit delta n=1 Tax=Polycladomyces subterraneus TaxID=1016997 RepID=A0ABT8IJ96_9BACL|nr:DNA-directed RNA polymerase subunit delta [Polycladomyces subterraneus]MDN4592813.1 DNA-directed RNA polymerase subunit delta [Polycladomyces subterraneus]